MPQIPFVGPAYNLESRSASVQRTINMVPVPLEPGNERAGWGFEDVPGLAEFSAPEPTPPVGACTEGPEWVVTTPTSANRQHKSISAGESGRFVIGDLNTSTGFAGSQFSTDNGATWQDGDFFNSFGHGLKVAFGNGIFFGVSNAVQSAVSADGDSWTVGSKPSLLPVVPPVLMNGAFFILDGAGVNWQSTVDGVAFNSGTFPPDGSGSTSGAYGEGKYVVVGPDGACHSADGVTWFAATTPSWTDKRSVAYGAGRFVSVGTTNTDDDYHYSNDGETWVHGTLPVQGQFRTVIYAQGVFLAVDYDSDVQLTSLDGLTWEQSPHEFTVNGAFDRIAYDGDGRYVVVATETAHANRGEC